MQRPTTRWSFDAILRHYNAVPIGSGHQCPPYTHTTFARPRPSPTPGHNTASRQQDTSKLKNPIKHPFVGCFLETASHPAPPAEPLRPNKHPILYPATHPKGHGRGLRLTTDQASCRIMHPTLGCRFWQKG